MAKPTTVKNPISQTERWELRFQELVQFKDKYEHCNVPGRWAENPKLGMWVSNQRKLYTSGKLSEGRYKKLKKIGFQFNPWDRNWEDMFQELIKFKKTHGHCRVPDKRFEYQKLCGWVKAQRQKHLQGKLSIHHYDQLKNIGFVWRVHDTSWNEMLDRLVGFKDVFGHCNVPHRWIDDLSLSDWVKIQRRKLRQGKLNKDRYQRLNKIGFSWEVSRSSWDEMYGKLVYFKEKIGHCDIPQGWSDDPSLSNWVKIQRQKYRKNQLTKDQFEQLNNIGFVWDVREAGWNKAFDSLVEFYREYGHCDVPARWNGGYSSLGRWIRHQRKRKREGKLKRDWVIRLDQVGFRW